MWASCPCKLCKQWRETAFSGERFIWSSLDTYLDEREMVWTASDVDLCSDICHLSWLSSRFIQFLLYSQTVNQKERESIDGALLELKSLGYISIFCYFSLCPHRGGCRYSTDEPASKSKFLSILGPFMRDYEDTNDYQGQKDKFYLFRIMETNLASWKLGFSAVDTGYCYAYFGKGDIWDLMVGAGKVTLIKNLADLFNQCYVKQVLMYLLKALCCFSPLQSN